MVKDRLKKTLRIDRPHPHQVISALRRGGHPWTVVQSLHLTCGHEFHRLVDEVKQPGIRTSLGLPLLYSPRDHQAVMDALSPLITHNPDEGVVLVGHGTDHPAWTTYTAFAYMLQVCYGSRVQMGVVEQGYPQREAIMEAMVKGGYKKVRLVPFMLVAGVHFQEDLAGEEDSWKAAFESVGVDVSLEVSGLGVNRKIVNLFCDHAASALDVIPRNHLAREPDLVKTKSRRLSR